MADPFSSHPYQGMRRIQPKNCYCELCDRSIAWKDKAAHERGKKHRDVLTAINEANGVSVEEKKVVGPNKDGSGCHNCGGKHMAKDCTEPRVDTRECHNCKQQGHQSKDCPEPRKDGRECHNCKQTGHISKECPNPRVMTCRNCDQEGHMAKECPMPRKPRDPATVICNNCQTLGHFARNCTNEKVEPESTGEFGSFGDFGGGDDVGNGGFGGGDASGGADFGGGGFDAPEAAPTAPAADNNGWFDAW